MSTMISCKSCNLALDDKSDWVHCLGCNSKLHYTPCSSLSESTWRAMGTRAKNDWRCISCREKQRSLFAKASTSDNITNVENAAKRHRGDVEQHSNYNLEKELNEIKMLLADMSSQMATLLNESKLKDLKISLLETKINKLEQFNIRKNIEIINVSPEKDPLEAVIDIGKEIDFIVEKTDIKKVFRTKNNKIIVGFYNKNKKDELIKKFKKHKKPSQGTFSRDRKRVFINDELTAFSRKLLWLTKQKSRQNRWKYVWVKDGRIFAKKDDNCRPIIINQEEDINLLQ